MVIVEAALCLLFSAPFNAGCLWPLLRQEILHAIVLDICGIILFTTLSAGNFFVLVRPKKGRDIYGHTPRHSGSDVMQGSDNSPPRPQYIQPSCALGEPDIFGIHTFLSPRGHTMRSF